MHSDKIAGMAQDNQHEINKKIDNPDQGIDKQDQGQDQKEDQEEEQESKIKIKFKTDNNPETEEKPGPKEPQFDCLIRTKSGRVSRPVHKYVTTHQGHLQTQAIESTEYLIKTAKVIAQTILMMNY
jgi:hypothetical protein